MKGSSPVKAAARGIDTRPELEGKASSIESFSMSEGNLLRSWKEIAAYLGCDIKTCGRWEKEADLPIRRILAGGRIHLIGASRF